LDLQRFLGRSLNCLFQEGSLLLRYPSTIPKLRGGLYRTAIYVDELLREEYAKEPVDLKHTHGFYIYLNTQEAFVTPWIGVVGSYELPTTEIFLGLLRKGSKVIDVGANVGWFTLLAASRIGNTGTVLSFEPETKSFELLSKSVARNRFDNVKLLSQIVYDSDGMGTLHLNPDESQTGLHSIVRDFGGKQLVVPSTKLDTAVTRFNINQVDVLKVDVEGAEPRVLAGAMSLISQRRVRFIVLEWNAEAWTQEKKLLDFLLAMYNVYHINYLPPLIRKLSPDFVRAQADKPVANPIQKNLLLELRKN
jgi:FkbM family methyltransferase